MKIHVLDTGYFKLDGGAMFGVVPKTIWSRTNPADDRNLCDWAMRCMLVEYDNRLVLIDTGIGNKQSEKFFGYYYLHETQSLEIALMQKGFSLDDITDVFLTHLHFDHCGGAIQWNSTKERLEPVFKNAKYWSHTDHWEWATNPNPREKASFLKENIHPIEETGQLQKLSGENYIKNIFPNFDVLVVNGHTESQMIPHITYQGKTIVFVADLLPSVGHIPLAYVIGYDTRPLLTLEEKGAFLNRAADNNFILFFEHDSVNECCTVQHTEKGVRLKETFPLASVL
ncbi:MAG: glyoxylase-like metal-dependent hydrolase (beta-lactamase superfamily II) [Sphingobacteriales bacterium]|jgi:glyoxylase-like metal-dependent hydrolase (beta-lactamase superfamily II)